MVCSTQMDEKVPRIRDSRRKENRDKTYREKGAESFNSHSSWPGQRVGRRSQASARRWLCS